MTVDAFDDATLEHRTAAEWMELALPQPPQDFLGRVPPTDPWVIANYEQRRLAEQAVHWEELDEDDDDDGGDDGDGDDDGGDADTDDEKSESSGHDGAGVSECLFS